MVAAARRRRWLWLLLIPAAIVLALLFAVGLPAGRGALLRLGLGVAERRLPGAQQLGEASWPRVGRLHLENYAWTDGPDTLVALRSLDLTVNQAALLRRHLDAEALTVDGLYVDLPALSARLTKGEAPADSSAPAPLDSVLAALPSLRVRALALTDARLRVAPDLPLLRLDLAGGADVAPTAPRSLRIDSLRLHPQDAPWALEHLSAALREEPGAPWAGEVALAGRFRGLHAALAAEGALQDSLRLRLSPVALGLADGEVWPPAAARPGRAALPRDLAGLRARSLQLTGALGEWDVAGAYGPADSLAATLAARWPSPPLAGARALLGDSLVDAIPPRLASLWTTDAAHLELSARGVVEPAPGGEFDLAAALPGLDFAAAGGASQAHVDLTARLALADLSAADGLLPAAFDSLRGRATLTASAVGAPRAPALTASLDLDAANRTLAARDLRLRLRQAPGHRRLQLRAPSGLRYGDVALDSLDLAVDLPPDSLTPLPASGRLVAAGRGLALGLRAGLRETADGFALAADSLALRSADGHHLAATRPFDAVLAPASRRLTLRDLALDGDLGTLSADGAASPDSADLRASLRLALPRAVLTRIDSLVALPTALDTLTLVIDLDAHGNAANPRADLALEASAAGPEFALPSLGVTLQQAADARRLTLALPQGLQFRASTVDSVTLALALPPDSLRVFPATGRLRAEAAGIGLSLDARVDQRGALLSLAGDSLDLRVRGRHLTSRGPFRVETDRATRLRVEGLTLSGGLGELRAAGTLDSTGVDLGVHVALDLPAGALLGLPGAADLPRADSLALGVAADVTLKGGTRDPALAAAGEVELREAGSARRLGVAVDLSRPAGDAEPLAGTLALSDANGALLSGTLALGGSLDLREHAWTPAGEEALDLALGPNTLPLARLAPYLPPSIGLEGDCRVQLAARGALDAPTLSGGLKTAQATARWNGQSWVALKGDVALGGNAARPRVTGSLATLSGNVRLPEPPRPLLPAEGGALLWDAAPATAPVVAPPPAAEQRWPDLDLTLSVPGDLWLRRSGLELELGGDLRLLRESAEAVTAQPRADGELSLRQGNAKFLGRRFDVERGIVTFFGEQAPDPALDLLLSSQLGDTKVLIAVGGTAKAPTFALSSEPEKSENEILALLLSGGASEQGGEDPGAQQQMRAAATALLSSLGVSRLQSGITWGGGFDQLEYRPGAEGQRGALMLGKYLSPRLLLQYEQSLSETSAFMVHLRYLLSRHWRIESSYAQTGPSGLELDWSRED